MDAVTTEGASAAPDAAGKWGEVQTAHAAGRARLGLRPGGGGLVPALALPGAPQVQAGGHFEKEIGAV